MTTKPHKGRIKNWSKLPCSHGLGFYVVGDFLEHPQFGAKYTNTSWVEKHDEATGEIETRNSRYTLLGAEVEPHGLAAIEKADHSAARQTTTAEPGKGEPRLPDEEQGSYADIAWSLAKQLGVANDFYYPLLTISDKLFKLEREAAPSRPPEPAEPPFYFDRYVGGQLMAEGVKISEAATLEEATAAAVRIVARGPRGEAPVLVLRRPPEPAASGEPTNPKQKLERRAGFWTHDDDAVSDAGHLYYFAPSNRAPGPYLDQREVLAVVDIAQDGTLAGVELIENMPPPPTVEASPAIPSGEQIELETSPEMRALVAEAIEEDGVVPPPKWIAKLLRDFAKLQARATGGGE